MKKLLFTLSLLIIFGISLNSCLKDQSSSPNPGYDVQSDASNATILLENPLDLYLQADRAIRLQHDSIVARNINQSSFSFKVGYINFTVSPADSTTYPKTITVDFGTDTTNTYTGIMFINMSGNMKKAGSTCGLTYENLATSNIHIYGNDSIVSQGVNGSGSVISRYNMNDNHLRYTNGSSGSILPYSGRIIGKYNLTTKANVIDSIEIIGTDDKAVGYRVFNYTSFKLQINSDCGYFNNGVIKCDISPGGVKTGYLIYDYSVSSTGNSGSCDDTGGLYFYSYTNENYSTQYLFAAKEFK